MLTNKMETSENICDKIVVLKAFQITLFRDITTQPADYRQNFQLNCFPLSKHSRSL